MDRYMAFLLVNEQMSQPRKLKLFSIKFALVAVIALLLAAAAFNFKEVNDSISKLDEQTEPA
ncbi:MAG: hypothetical protein UX81_C0001G0014 [Parcubacteria group bacterium GW2011_GWA2_47_12]|uniref:Uncharacterized protein n=1 Tax=Candidatus Giovannonibacteria bacterium RIFCSPLOWO2_01_FULL_44_16 TaxID=1798348 RepID=A0A1F5X267_9BACT|nr:MAG: hypothetical protein UX81_C0001G0014 [Parcubacteria group bacterium GW2011_GWA2_47_12]OGF81997.1 MAG: hypothetical protein A2924_04300 [Candidatus Giovannonibacteria bacterium RIFCSPLOWO2_01_FULL_44_16]